jgi:thiaminase (transcriptional activator TenA)
MTANSLFARLRDACADDWQAYVAHPFVAGIQDGTLPEACFKHYLVQDYLFLIHFSRAYALTAYKADTLEDLRAAAESLRVITDVEMGLHVEFCREWGLSEQDMLTAPEAEENMAYTRYVLERGMAGDVLDLHVALAPCMCGYADIGKRLGEDPATVWDGNPYKAWIEMYASDDYQEGTVVALEAMDRLYERRAGENRMPDLIKTFRQATRLEIGFWQMGMDAA